MSKTKANKAYALVSYYILLYKEKYGKEPTINRHRDRWGFEDMIEDLSEYEARLVMDYYFTTNKFGHPLNYLFRNYDKLYIKMNQFEQDKLDRQKLLRETKARVEEWENKVGDGRIQND